MIIALIGLDRQLIGQDVYVAVIVVSLPTTVVTPPVLKGLSREGPRRPAAAPAS